MVDYNITLTAKRSIAYILNDKIPFILNYPIWSDYFISGEKWASSVNWTTNNITEEALALVYQKIFHQQISNATKMNNPYSTGINQKRLDSNIGKLLGTH